VHASRKRKIIKWAIVVSLLAGVWFSKRIRLDYLAFRHDPAQVTLRHGGDSKSFAILPNRMEYGLIHLKDGETVKYWSLGSHAHLGMALTRFDFQDGQRVYLKGGICCEVAVENTDRPTMLRFIERNQGTSG
jgi:hypothetical protein